MGRGRYAPRRGGRVVNVRVVDPPPAGRDGSLGTAIAVVTGAAGLVAYLYFLGGVVTWINLTATQLAGDAGIVATDSKRLLAIGSRVAAFELLLLLLVSALVTLLVGFAIFRRGALPQRSISDFTDLKKGWGDLWTLGGMIAPAFAILLIGLGLSVNSPDLRCILLVLGGAIGLPASLAMVLGAPPKGGTGKKPPRWQRALAFLGRRIRGAKHGIRGVQWVATLMILVNCVVAIVLVPILQGTVLLAATAVIYAGPFLAWPRSSGLREFGAELVRSNGVWVAIAAATVVALAWVATPPVEYPQAKLRIEGRPDLVSGAYIDRTADGVYVGLCKVRVPPDADGDNPPYSTKSHIVFFAKDRLTRIEIGGERYVFDPGGRPSLGQVFLAGLGGGSAARKPAPLHYELRPRLDRICGVDPDD